MHATIGHYGAKLFALTLITFTIASCGGGTTGTSSTDSVKFAGYAEQTNGDRSPFLSMTVSSGTSGEDLRNSGTNADGDFDMVLPASESSLVIDVVGVGTTTMRRLQQGPGTLSTKLAATGEGIQSELQFEAQVSQQNLCSSLVASGDELTVVADEDQVPCPATITIASKELTLGNFEGAVVARCAGANSTLTTAWANDGGNVTLDLSAALTAGCSEIQIVVSHPQAPGLESVFYVK